MNLAELIAALPEEERPNDVAAAQEQMAGLYQGASLQPVPVNPFHRVWALGGLQAWIALAYTSWWVRGWFETADQHKQRLADTNLRAGLRALRSMTYLRGAVMKFGQLLASAPEFAPEAIVSALERLHFQAPPMHFSLLREMVRGELGGDPEDVFAAFDPSAFAAASLGQVHRARLKSGEEVAVKIQYPGIARAIESDLRTLSALMLPVGLNRDWEIGKAQFEEIRRMLNEETDYTREAGNAELAGALFRAEDGIVVPRIFREFSTRRVLTMEFLDAQTIDGFLAGNPSQPSRDDFGAKIYRASFRMYYHGFNYTDPSAGNFLFFPDGRLGIVDFGSVWHFNEQERRFLAIAEQYVDNPSSPEFWEFLKQTCHLNERDLRDTEYMDLLKATSDWVVETLRRDEPFDFSDPAHLQRYLRLSGRLFAKRKTKADPMHPFLSRTYIGVRSVLYRLRAQVNVRRLWREEGGSAS